MYNLNLNKDLKIEEMKINICFYRHILMTQIDLCNNLLIIAMKKFLNVWKINVI